MNKNINYKIKGITTDAIFIALTFIFTFINIKLPIAANGGLIHLGNVPFFVGAVIMGKRTGTLAGAIGMCLFDLMSGWVLWAPFTFFIVGIMGFVIGSVAHDKKNYGWTMTAFFLAGIIKVAGYYLAEWVLYGNSLAPISSIPGNVIQIVVGAAISFPIIVLLKKTIKI